MAVPIDRQRCLAIVAVNDDRQVRFRSHREAAVTYHLNTQGAADHISPTQSIIYHTTDHETQ